MWWEEEEEEEDEEEEEEEEEEEGGEGEKTKNCFLLRPRVDRHAAVGIATRQGLDGPGNECRLGARFSAPVQTGPGAHPASYTMGTGSLPG
jgi:TATA-binding protein-associated factor Taf7